MENKLTAPTWATFGSPVCCDVYMVIEVSKEVSRTIYHRLDTQVISDPEMVDGVMMVRVAMWPDMIAVKRLRRLGSIKSHS